MKPLRAAVISLSLLVTLSWKHLIHIVIGGNLTRASHSKKKKLWFFQFQQSPNYKLEFGWVVFVFQSMAVWIYVRFPALLCRMESYIRRPQTWGNFCGTGVTVILFCPYCGGVLWANLSTQNILLQPPINLDVGKEKFSNKTLAVLHAACGDL